VSRDGRKLILLVADGREFSEGATFPDLADLLISYGAYTGMALDGGGSSALIVKGFDGRARALNMLMEDNIPGKERAVANHLGIYIKS
jgi:exopolysaccharide biosynthesis protein